LLPSQTDLASESIDEKAMLYQKLPPTKLSLSPENLRKRQTPSDILNLRAKNKNNTYTPETLPGSFDYLQCSQLSSMTLADLCFEIRGRKLLRDGLVASRIGRRGWGFEPWITFIARLARNSSSCTMKHETPISKTAIHSVTQMKYAMLCHAAIRTLKGA